jgi:ABC-2 type transport system permease protein
MNEFILPTLTLWWREIVRFYRDRSRVIGSLAPPLIFWVLIGFGLAGSFQSPGGSKVAYLEYLFAGVAVLIVLFTAIFSTISIIEDRREGFMQSVLVAPVSRGAIVMGKILGGSSVALLQGLIFVLLAPLAGISIGFEQALELILVLFGIAFALTGLGFLIAWNMRSTQGFHGIMNLFLMPMWLLSGSLFPVAGAAGWLKKIMMLNPLTYGLSAFQDVLLGSRHPAGVASLPVCLGVIVFFGLAMFALSWKAALRRQSADMS